MKRALLTFLFAFASLQSFACDKVTSDSTPGFCTTFAEVSVCQCNSIMPNTCNTIQDAYSNMVANYGPGVEQAITNACEFGQLMGWAPQHDCEDQWHCYLNGGVDSHGNACYGATGPKSYCQKLSASAELKTRA